MQELALFQTFSFTELLTRLGIAALCGLVIGLDREVKGKPMGLRTFMLVTVACAGFVIIMLEIGHQYVLSLEESERQMVRIHTTEMVNGLITGIGFLGAGAIMRNKADGDIKGATTGASIWMSGAIGAACGLGFFGISLLLTAFTFVIVTVLGWAEHCCQKKASTIITEESK